MNRTYSNAWIQTYTGKKFWPLEPDAADVHLLDIAHALSNTCRYAGHCSKFYSVAEHSWLLSHLVSPANALWALLHDAGEAYLADIPRPIKQYLTGFHELEAAVMKQVCLKFGLPLEEPEEVRAADFRITSNEKLALMSNGPAWDNLQPPFPGFEIRGLVPKTARTLFVKRFMELYRP